MVQKKIILVTLLILSNKNSENPEGKGDGRGVQIWTGDFLLPKDVVFQDFNYLTNWNDNTIRIPGFEYYSVHSVHGVNNNA